jgi:hypothetical protein
MGRKGRHVHQFGTASKQSESGRNACGTGAFGFRHLPGGGRQARMPRGAVSRMEDSGRFVQRMAARLARPSVRLFGHRLSASVAGWTGSVAAARRFAANAGIATLSRWRFSDTGRACSPVVRTLGTVSRTAQPRVSAGAQHRAHRGTLAHRNQDPPGSDSGAALTAGRGWK